jgi:hypothetical protein
VVLLILSAVLSAPTSTALVGAGSALAGVAAARIIDLEREHRLRWLSLRWVISAI